MKPMLLAALSMGTSTNCSLSLFSSFRQSGSFNTFFTGPHLIFFFKNFLIWTDRRRQRQYPFGLKGQGVKWNNWYHFHFYFNYHLMYFQLKTNSVGITEVSVGPMANNMYFIQWIIISYYRNGYELYRNNSVCIKIVCMSYCSHILSWFNWCCKIQLCYDEYLVKLIQ